MCFKCVNDRGQYGFAQGWRGRELLLEIVCRLLDQNLIVQEFTLDRHRIGQLIIVAEIAGKEIVQLLKDLGQQRLFLVLDAAGSCLGHRLQLLATAIEGQVFLALGGQLVMGQDDLAQIDAFPFPAKIQKGDQASEKDAACFDRGRSVIKDLRQEGVKPQVSPDVRLEDD